MLPVRVRPGLLLEAAAGWSALARDMGAGRQPGDVTECPLPFDTVDWPADTQALVLMLWPQVSLAFRARAAPEELQAEVAAAAAVAAAQARAGAAYGVPGPATAPMPGNVLNAILDALAHQARPGGSLAGSVLPGPAGSLAPAVNGAAGVPGGAENGPAARM